MRLAGGQTQAQRAERAKHQRQSATRRRSQTDGDLVVIIASLIFVDDIATHAVGVDAVAADECDREHTEGLGNPMP